MTPELYKRAREAFHGAWERPPGERTAFLDGVCGTDKELRAQVESLLASADHRDQFMARSTVPGMDMGMGMGTGDNFSAMTSPVIQTIPERVGRYRIIRLIGEGGMGSAYEAQQESPARRVAVKTIRPGLGTVTMLRRFAHEAQILGRLRHAGIAQVYEAGIAEGPVGPIPYIAMELVAGVSLDVWVKEHKPSRHTRIELLAKVCDAVQHAHQHGVIHRDLKPGNILVETGAQDVVLPKVLDFGVARLIDPDPTDAPLTTLGTDPGTLIGTLAYMSPEQVAGNTEGVDARADVYALGVLLFELLTGRLPRETSGKSIAEAARIIRDEEPLRARALDASLRGDLDTICAKALERDPAHRYQTASELATDLRRYLGDEPIIARPATVTYQARKFARRHKGLVAGLIAAAVVLVIGVASTLWYAVAAGHERSVALEQKAAARWTSYKLTISAAQDGVAREPTRTRAQLADAPESLRNWEWRHLMARLDPPTMVVECDPGVRASGAFTPAGAPIAGVVRGGRLEVVDIATGAALASFPAGPGLTGTRISADARFLAAFERNAGKVAVYAIESATTVLDRSFGNDHVLAIGLSPDGSLLGVVVQHRGLFVLNIQTGKQIRSFEFDVQNAGYDTVEFSPDLKSMLCGASSTDVGARITIYDLAGQTPARTVDEAFAGAFNPLGTLFATSTIGGIRLRDATSLALRSEIHGQFREAPCLAFSGDGAHLVSFVGRTSIQAWDVQTRELELAVSSQPMTSMVVASPLGDYVLACSPGRVDVYPLRDCTSRILRGHSSFVYSIAWSVDGKLVASASWDKTVRVWDASTGEPIITLEVQPDAPLAPIGALSFSKDGKNLLVLTHEGKLLVFPGKTLRQPGAAAPPPPLPAPTAVGDAALDTYWRLARPDARKVESTGGERSSTSADAKLISIVENDAVLVHELATGAQRIRIKTDQGLVYSTAFSPDNLNLATGGRDHTIRIWNLSTGALVADLQEHEGAIYTLAFTPDGSRLVSGDAIGLIYLWDTQRHEKVAELRGHTSYVHSVAFSPDGHTLCSGSGDGTVRLWQGSASKPGPR